MRPAAGDQQHRTQGPASRRHHDAADAQLAFRRPLQLEDAVELRRLHGAALACVLARAVAAEHGGLARADSHDLARAPGQAAALRARPEREER